MLSEAFIIWDERDIRNQLQEEFAKHSDAHFQYYLALDNCIGQSEYSECEANVLVYMTARFGEDKTVEIHSSFLQVRHEIKHLISVLHSRQNRLLLTPLYINFSVGELSEKPIY